MTKFSDLGYDRFLELVNFLLEHEKDLDDNSSKAFAVVKDLNRFIPNISAKAAVGLNDMVSNILDGKSVEKEYNLFISLYPELEFDPNGKSKPKLDYADLSRESIAMVYDEAYAYLNRNGWKDTSPNKANLQIWNAFTLSCLVNVPSAKIYNGEKALYYKNNKSPIISRKDLDVMERECEWLAGAKNSVMNKFLMYIKNKDRRVCEIFAKHFQKRLQLAYEDIDRDYAETNIFIKNLKKLG